MATARKTPTRKTAPKPAAKVASFEEFRQRASGLTLTTETATKREPFVLGPDRGFDPPIAVVFPSKLSEQIELDMLSRRSDTFGMLQLLMGGQFLRVVQRFDNEPDAPRLLAGLVLMIMDHFLGQGADAVGVLRPRR